MHIEALQVRSQHPRSMNANQANPDLARSLPTSRTPGRLSSLVYGAIGGATAAAAMTVLRLGARRAGLIDLMVPEAVEQWLDAHGAQPSKHPALRSATDQLLHCGYGAVWGAAFGPLLTVDRSPIVGAVLLGVTQWLAGPAVVLPLLSISRRPAHTDASALAVNALAHGVYAATAAFVAHELSDQGRRPKRQRSEQRLQSDVG